jgi:hypothetical protein
MSNRTLGFVEILRRYFFEVVAFGGSDFGSFLFWKKIFTESYLCLKNEVYLEIFHIHLIDIYLKL